MMDLNGFVGIQQLKKGHLDGSGNFALFGSQALSGLLGFPGRHLSFLR